MSNKSSKFLAPIVIAGVTVGFLASAYKFVFAKPKQTDKSTTHASDASTHASSTSVKPLPENDSNE